MHWSSVLPSKQKHLTIYFLRFLLLCSFVGAGFSLQKTKDVLSSIASDCLVEGGQCVNAVEVFWTPGEPNEVLSSRDVVLDFPEIIDL
jgi:uncharacterized membrane protein